MHKVFLCNEDYLHKIFKGTLTKSKQEQAAAATNCKVIQLFKAVMRDRRTGFLNGGLTCSKIIYVTLWMFPSLSLRGIYLTGLTVAFVSKRKLLLLKEL